MPALPPYELRIGVTGHRELADEKPVTQAVEQLLDRFFALLGAHADVVPVAVSPLARGADRVVARAVLRRPGGVLEAVLPLSAERYVQDFPQPADRQEFQRLYEQARRVLTLPPTGDAAAGRGHAYRAAGQAVVDTCEILIAIWDGQPSAGPGGTAEIVEYALVRGRIVLWIDPAASTQAPRLLQLRRGAADAPVTAVTDLAVKPLPGSMRRLSPGYWSNGRLGRELARVSVSSTQGTVRRMRDDIHGQMRAAGLTVDAVPETAEGPLTSFAALDQLATRYQRRHVRAGTAVYYCAAAAVTASVAQLLFWPGRAWTAGVELLAMMGGVGALVLSRRLGWHERWLDYRYLAERLRLHLYTASLAAPVPANAAALPLYAGPKPWLETWVQRIVTQVPPSRAGASFEAAKRFVIDSWLRDQQQWHARNARRKEQHHRRNARLVFGVFAGTLGLTAAQCLGWGGGSLLTLVAMALPAWGSALYGMGSQLELERLAARSLRMSRLLEGLTEQAELASDAAQLQGVLNEAMRVVSLEQQEWWVLLSFQPLELVA